MMNWLKTILFFVIFTPIILSGQDKYCIYEYKALKAYENKEYLTAKLYMDSALSTCIGIKEKAYTWHVLGFIYYDIFKKIDKKDPTSLAREKSIMAIKSSLKLDTICEFETINNGILINLAITYWNDCITNLDTNNYEQAISFYDSHKQLSVFANRDYNLNQYQIVYNQALANIYSDKFENTQNKNMFFLAIC